MLTRLVLVVLKLALGVALLCAFTLFILGLLDEKMVQALLSLAISVFMMNQGYNELKMWLKTYRITKEVRKR
ncbi:MAG: hypothetical protein QXS32_08850 [Candidatus Nezhaarchaeales archaeon]